MGGLIACTQHLGRNSEVTNTPAHAGGESIPMREITGPFDVLGKQVHDKRVESQKVDELRLMRKELLAMSERAFLMDVHILGSGLLTLAETAGNLIRLMENA